MRPADGRISYSDPIDQHAPDVRRTARALVATEWKRVQSAADLEAKAFEARDQLKRYQQGALADLVLTATRFAVMVSKKDLRTLDDVTENGITYRHITIAVDPETPSKAAQAAARASR